MSNWLDKNWIWVKKKIPHRQQTQCWLASGYLFVLRCDSWNTHATTKQPYKLASCAAQGCRSRGVPGVHAPPDFGRLVNPTGGGGILFVPHYYLSLRFFRPTYGPATRVAHKPNHMDDYIFKAQQQSMVNCLLSRLVYIQSLALHAFSLSMQGLAFCWMQASHRACSDSYDFGSHSRLWNTPVIFLLRSSFSVFWKLKNKFSSHP